MVHAKIQIEDGEIRDMTEAFGFIYVGADDRFAPDEKEDASSNYAEEAGEHRDGRTVAAPFDYTAQFLVEAYDIDLINLNTKITAFNDAIREKTEGSQVVRRRTVTLWNIHDRVKITGTPELVAVPKERYHSPTLGITDYALIELKIHVSDPTLCDFNLFVGDGNNLLTGTDFRGDFKSQFCFLFRMFNNYGPEPNFYENPNGFNGCGVIGVEKSSAALFTDICRQLIISADNAEHDVLETDTWYTASFFAKGTSIGLIPTVHAIDTTSDWIIDGVPAKVSDNKMRTFGLSDNWVRHTLVFKTKESFEGIDSTEIIFRLQAGETAYLSQIKLEKGINLDARWTPSPNDREVEFMNIEP